MTPLALLASLAANLAGMLQPTAQVRFAGNHQIDDVTLSALLAGGDSYRSILDDEGLARDALRLYAAYCDRGLIQARISQERVLSADRRSVTAIFHIVEGEPFTVGRISATGDRLRLFPAVAAAGDIFRRSQIVGALQQVTRRYRARGYDRVLVTPLTRIDLERHLLDVTFEITPGSRRR